MPISSERVTPAALRLVLMLCRHPGVHRDADEAAKLCAEIDKENGKADRRPGWELFLQLAAHHRVLPLVAAHARQVTLPTPVAEALCAYASQNALEAFRWLAETQRLQALLSKGGIAATILKGVPLSLQAYGDVATRDVGDIDLLIQPEDAKGADLVLERSGYWRKDPGGKLTPRRRASYAAHFKDYTYESDAMQIKGGFEVDLHWRLFRNPLMPGNALAETDPVQVPVGSIQMTSLSCATHLLYLAVQGAVDGWTRLKAAADVAALWNVSNKAEVLEVAREAGVLPYLFAAITLADGWVGDVELPENFQVEKTLQHPLTRSIVERARQRMSAANFLPGLRETSSWESKRYEASLCSDHGYKWAIARRILFRPRVWTRFDLPDALFPLYPLLSPVEWLLFHLRSGKAKR